MKKQIISVVLIFSILGFIILPVTVSAATSGTCGDSLTWILENGTLTISGTGYMEDYYDHTSSPWYSQRSSIKKIIINKGVSSIGRFAFFYCTNLEKVTMADTVTVIQYGAFYHCNSLSDIIISKNVHMIAPYVFYTCRSLTNITIPVNVRKIEGHTFESCDSLTSITMYNNITEIGTYAFFNCSSLTDVYFIGTTEKWYDEIYMGAANENLIDAVIHIGTFSGSINSETSKRDEYNNELSQDLITVVGNSLNLTNNSFTSFGAVEDTLRGPKITILNKSFYLFELPINMSVKTPLGSVRYNAEKEKYEIMLGKLDKTALAGEDDKNKTYNEIKEFVNFCGKSTSADTWNRYQHLQKVLKSDSMSFGFSFNATPAGYMEFDKNGKLLEGAIVYVLNMDANYKQPIPAVPVVYVKVGIGVDATGKFGIKSIESNAYSLFGSLGLEIAPYVGVGVGSSKIVNIEGGAKLKLKTQLELVKNKELSDIFSASMTGQLYIKLKALSFVNFDKKWDIASVSLYPDFGASVMSLSESYDDMIIMPSDYAEYGSDFVANNNISFFSLDNIETSAFKTNIYPYAEPQLVKLSNGNELLVWIDNDTSRSDINCTVLKYSVNNGIEWSEPADIYNNGTADFSPKLTITAGGAALVWQKANSVLAEDTTLPEMAENMDIYYSTFDGAAWTEPIKLTDNTDIYEFVPVIACNGEEITVSWLTNSENDYFAFSGTNTVNYKSYNGGWSEAFAVASDLGSVSNLSVSYIDGKAVIAYTKDCDNNIETSDDIELYEFYDGQLMQVTYDEVIDYALTKTDTGYFWIHNNQLWERNANGVELIEIPVFPVYLDNAKILTNGADRVIIYEQANEYSSDLYAMNYDSDDKTWGEPIRLTDDNMKIRETNGYLTSDGALRLAFGQAEINEDADDIYGICNLMISNITEKSDIEVTSASCVYNEYVTGEEATIYANIKNNSSSKISKFNVEVAVDDNVVASQIVETELLSGGTAAIEIPYTLPEDLSGKQYTVTVEPSEKTDDDMSNNTVAFEMGFSDIEVSASVLNERLIVSISNIGYLKTENVMCTLTAADGTILTMTAINSLSVGENKQLQFDVPGQDSVTISVTSGSKENVYANNVTSVTLSETMAKGVHIAFGEYTADNENLNVEATIANDFDSEKEIVAYIAAYREGKLLDCSLTNTTLKAHSSQLITKTFSRNDEADTVKVFVWKSLSDITPQTGEITLDITYPEQ